MPNPKPYATADGRTTYRVRFRHGGKNTSETFRSRTKAQAFCRDLADLGPARAVQRLEESLHREDEPTVDAVFEAFLVWKAPRVRSDRTIADYRRDYTNWVRPALGHRIAALVTQEDVQTWVDAMVDGTTAYRGRRAGAKSIHDRHALLHSVMAFAVRRKHADVNPCVDTDLPGKAKGNPKGLHPAEWQALAIALRQIEPDAADLADFLLASGWRWSEATALSTFDVEDNGSRVWVTMGQVIRRNAAGQHVIVADGKGEGSMRRVELDTDAAALVRRRVAAQTPGELVFTTAGGAQWRYSNFTRRYWDKAVKAANLNRKPTPHWLRHTAVYWLTLAGATMPELQSRIGHRNITTTINVYGRMLTDVQQSALSGFAAMRTGNAGSAPAALAAAGTGPAERP